MQTFSRAVVAVDGSSPADRAVAFAVEVLAARGGVRLAFASAVDATVAYIPAAQGAAVNVAGIIETLEKDASDFCAAAGKTASASGIVSDVAVLQGGAVDALLGYAKEQGADAIVVGTHARRGLARGILGSVASSIVRGSSVPVFVVRADAAIRPGGPIVVAVDDSPPAQAALASATALAQKLRLPLRLVHVASGDRPLDERRLAALAAPPRALGLGVETERVASGDPAAVLVGAARSSGASLIATGTHGRGPLERLVLGSVAETLLHDAPVPVLAVRA